MARTWIEEGLRHTAEREEAHRHVLDRRHHWHRLIEERGPDTMRALVDELAACLDEYRRGLPTHRQSIAFERLPRGGFLISRTEPPRAFLQGRPDYAAQTVYCNWAHVGEDEHEMVEVPFNLHFTVDESNAVVLRHGTRSFAGVQEVAEFLLSPVLFPGLKRGTEDRSRAAL